MRNAFVISFVLFFCIVVVSRLVNFVSDSHPESHPDSYEIKSFVYIDQPDDISCGPTSTLMVLHRYGKKVALDEVKQKTKTQWLVHKGKPIGMTSPDYIAIAMSQYDVRAKMKHLNIDQLKHYVSQNKPVIVLVRSGVKTWHYIVVIGFSSEDIIVADPGGGIRERLLLKNFIGAWGFSTDMDGVSVLTKCTLCNGTGSWLNANLGPLSVCQWCNGTGQQPDVIGGLVRSADIYPTTAIVPMKSLD